MTRIYLDHAAATPCRPEVREAMSPYLAGTVGNPSSPHGWGREARAALEEARERTAGRLGVEPGEVRFVRGGTESTNLAVLGRVGHLLAGGRREIRLVRSAVEHSAVREAMEAAKPFGARVVELPVEPSGRIPSPLLQEAVQGADLVSVQWVNQETGIVLPVEEVARACRTAGVPLHVDAIQAVGRIRGLPAEPPAELLSVSGHKLGGPRGIGALVVRKGVEIRPLLFGGGQEGGLRPGTEDVAGAVGFARALEAALDGLEEEGARLARLRGKLESALAAGVPGLRVHGAEAPRAAHILNVGVPGLPRDVLPGALDLAGVGASPGSACRSGATDVSPVLEALYGPEAREVAPLRLSLGWTTTEEEVSEAARRIPRVVERVRALGVGT